MISIILKKCVRLLGDPVVAQENDLYRRKEHRKLCESMSIMVHLMKLINRYHGTKDAREYKEDELPLGSLAAPADLEENDSHHFSKILRYSIRSRGRREKPTIQWKRASKTMMSDIELDPIDGLHP